MSTEAQKKYTRLLIQAEAARAVGDFEDYRAFKVQIKQLTQNSL